MNFKPDMYKKNIYEINYEKLKKIGIRYLFFDVDNTLISYLEDKPTTKNKELFDKLKKMGFTCFLFSNSHNKRILPFSKYLDVDVYTKSMKPLKKNYKKVLKLYKKGECAFIGDQIMTDVLGAKRNGFYVIFIDKLNEYEPIYTKFWRLFERIILKKYERANIFIKGRYYE